MAVIYGVLRGRSLDRWKREDPPPGSKKSPHLQVRLIDGAGKPWRIPVNVRSGDPAKSLVIFHQADPLVSHPILDAIAAMPAGLTDLNHRPRSASNALDYSRAPLFDWPTGIALPPTGPADNDDLQDVVSRHLADLKASGGELLAFGSHFHDAAPKPGIDAEFGTRDGMHDIHMNQGNAPHEHDEDNGVFRRRPRPALPRPRHRAVLPVQDTVPADRRQRRLHSRRVEGNPARKGLPVETPPVPTPSEPDPALPSGCTSSGRSSTRPAATPVRKSSSSATRRRPSSI